MSLLRIPQYQLRAHWISISERWQTKTGDEPKWELSNTIIDLQDDKEMEELREFESLKAAINTEIVGEIEELNHFEFQ